MNKVRIVSAITSATGITLYTDEGNELNLPMTGWRTKAIMDEVTRPLARNRTVEIDLDSYSVEAQVEQKSGGVISFLRKKVRDFAGFFKLTPTPMQELDALGDKLDGIQPPVSDVDETAPTIDPNTDTVVAVINGVEIPGMEKIERQIEHAALNNTKGLELFLSRIASKISNRGHSVQELLNFMQRGDLPIADDGSIVAYKVLRSTSDKGVYVDCHTMKVRQALGSRVSMDEKLVDPSRRTECSTGLHVARRGYLRNFPADVATLIKVAPEDVIAVPHREPDKMRVAAYQIVAVLPDAAYELLRADKPMTSNVEAARILASVIAGDHPGVLEEVVIGGPKGTEINTTALVEPPAEVEVEVAAAVEKPVDHGLAKTLDEMPAPAVSIAEIKEVADEEAQKRIDARERDNARRREQRAAAKATKADTISEKPKKSKKAPTKTKSTAAVLTPASVAVAPGEVPEKYREAVQAVMSGEISQREAERRYLVSAKKLRSLIRDLNNK